MNHILDPIASIILLAMLVLSAVFNVIFCEFGELVADQFEIFNDAIIQSNWYLAPIQIQKMLIIVMANSQRPTLIRGYGNILCVRETLKKVKPLFIVLFSLFLIFMLFRQTTNASFSYFMMLRRIDG